MFTLIFAPKIPQIMKKIVLPVLVAVGSFIGLTAQAQNGTATASVSAVLSDILDVHIGGAANTTATVSAANFNTAAAYLDGVSVPQDNHLYVVASKSFTIKASSTDLDDGNSNTISAGGINLAAANSGTLGTTNLPTGTAYVGTTNGINLSNTAANLITTSGGTPLYTFKVTYTFGGGSRAALFIGKPTGTYTATVTYTIL